MASMSCQRCRQPIAGIEDSLAALSPSAYDIISGELELTPPMHTSTLNPHGDDGSITSRPTTSFTNSYRHLTLTPLPPTPLQRQQHHHSPSLQPNHSHSPSECSPSRPSPKPLPKPLSTYFRSSRILRSLGRKRLCFSFFSCRPDSSRSSSSSFTTVGERRQQYDRGSRGRRHSWYRTEINSIINPLRYLIG